MTAAPPRPRLLVDVTRTLDCGLHSGIQRVVRGLFRGARLHAGDFGLSVHAVRYAGAQWIDIGELPPHPLEMTAAPEAESAQASGDPADATVREVPADGSASYAPQLLEPRPGDLLLLADASWYGDPWPAVEALRGAGGQVLGFVHDLIPLHHPQWFRAGVGARFEGHLRTLLRSADLLITPTRHVAEQLRELTTGPAPLLVLPLASDLAKDHGGAVDGGAGPLPLPCGERPYFLSVATLEPRKNHALLLDAFETRWARGGDEALLLVGARGWRNDSLLRRVTGHRELGRRLHWLQQIDDRALYRLYRGARGLLYLSRDEGFGLPVLEARQLRCPVIASDIPPLREAGADWPRYLPVDDEQALLHALCSPAPAPSEPEREPGPDRDWACAGRALLMAVRERQEAAAAAYSTEAKMTPKGRRYG